MRFDRNLGYVNTDRTQYLIRYRQNGVWRQKVFNKSNSGNQAQKFAIAFQTAMKSKSDVDAVTRVQIIQN